MKKMVFKPKIKWVALFVLALSMGSLVVHLSITKFSGVGLVQYTPMAGLRQDFGSLIELRGGINKKLWGAVKSLESLQPYANPRTNYPAPNENNNGFIYAKIFGGFEKIRSSICDLVTISRLLNATLVIPEIQESLRSKGISYKFKSFSYLYDEEHFIASLTNDVIIMKNLPENLKAARKRNEFPTFKPKSSATPNYYIKEILPKLKKAQAIGLVLTDGGCLQVVYYLKHIDILDHYYSDVVFLRHIFEFQSILPPTMSELQRLRCRVAFHALQFRPEIQILGRRIVERLRAFGQPFLAYHPGLVRDTLAYHGCAELFQDIHTELIQYRRAQMIKQGIINEELSVDSHLHKDKGSCPLMPEEVGLLLRALGYPPKTIIYLTGSETFGGHRVLIPLRGMFANLVDRTSFSTWKELSDVVGPETSLPQDFFRPPPAKSEKQVKEDWIKAGPRPRPHPPPPDRPIYQHEKEGWYAWITETDTEPNPSALDLRNEAHRLLWDALDYIVSVEADAFFPGFHNDGSKWPDFASLVMGQRLYESASSRTYRPDRKVIAELFNIVRENMYHPKHNWTLLVKEHLNKSLDENGLIRQSLLSKPVLFLSHPLPECSCRTSAAKVLNQTKGKDGRFLYGGEDECPKWMQRGQEAVSIETDGGKTDDSELAEYEGDTPELEESDNSDNKNATLPFDRDEEWDPND